MDKIHPNSTTISTVVLWYTPSVPTSPSRLRFFFFFFWTEGVRGHLKSTWCQGIARIFQLAQCIYTIRSTASNGFVSLPETPLALTGQIFSEVYLLAWNSISPDGPKLVWRVSISLSVVNKFFLTCFRYRHDIMNFAGVVCLSEKKFRFRWFSYRDHIRFHT